jgi:membrane protease YdiL (CAAX protease family)
MNKRARSPQDTPQRGFFRWLGLPQNPPPWGVPDVGLLLVVLALSMLVVASGVAVALSGDTAFVTPVTLVVGWCAGCVLVTAYLWATRRRTPQSRAAMRLERSLMPLPLVLLLGVAFGATIDVLAGLTSGGFRPWAELRGLQLRDASQVALALVFAGGLLPLSHGLAFAGVMLPALRVALGPWPGLLATALIFTGYHFLAFGASLPAEQRVVYGGLVPLATMFCVAAVRVRSGSTLAAVAAYAGAGLVAVLLGVAAG